MQRRSFLKLLAAAMLFEIHNPRAPALASEPAPAKDRGVLRLSEEGAEFLRHQTARGLRPATLTQYRLAVWSFLEYVGCDLLDPRRELPKDTNVQYVHWLRNTPIAPRKAHSLPKAITPASVRQFLLCPPRRSRPGALRQENTVGRQWRHAWPFLKWLGLPVEIEDRRQKPKLALPPPLVPSRATIRGWWADCLGTGQTAAMPPYAQRRRVVLTQALVLLTGMRIGEALRAAAADVEGHFLLLPPAVVKTGMPRILYLSSQALGIVAALRPETQQGTLFHAAPHQPRLLGWTKSMTAWHNLVRQCTSPGQDATCEKRQQALRRKLSDWLERKDPAAEALQLGHGKGVVFDSYLDTLRRAARHLEMYRLPEIEAFPWPAPVAAKLRRPDRLYNQFRRLVNQR